MGRRAGVMGVLLTGIILSHSVARATEIRVVDSQELLQAARGAVPGTTILLEPGEYAGGLYLQDLACTIHHERQEVRQSEDDHLAST